MTKSALWGRALQRFLLLSIGYRVDQTGQQVVSYEPPVNVGEILNRKKVRATISQALEAANAAFKEFGAYKFTAEEAQGIAPLGAHSPLFNWLQTLLGTQAISNVIGSSEIVIALLMATRPFSARLSSIGASWRREPFLPP